MKTTIEIDLKWYRFDQNNSGGRFIVNDQVAHDVFVQATSEQDAISRAHAILDDSGMDWCPCCGERWSFYSPEAGDVPTVYGEPLTSTTRSFMRDEARLHYFDGRIEAIKLPQKESK